MKKVWHKWWFWVIMLFIVLFIAPVAYINYVQNEKQRAIHFVKSYRGEDGEGPTIAEAVAIIITVAYEPRKVSAKWDAAMRDGGWRVDLYVVVDGKYLNLYFWTDFKIVKGLNEPAEKTIEFVNLT